MIRTIIVELSTIEAAAYRQKLRGGHSGIVIMRYDSDQPGMAAVNRKSGEPDPSQNTNLELFPLEAFGVCQHSCPLFHAAYRPAVYVWSHETGALEKVADDFAELEAL